MEREILDRIFLKDNKANDMKMVERVSKFIADDAIAHKKTLFQSAFGFMNNDIPFTMLIYKPKELESDEVDYVRIEYDINDWGTFGIENDKFEPIEEWELRCPNNIMNFPNWKEMTALQLFNEIVNFVWYVDVERKDIQNAVLDILRLNYSSAQDAYPCDELEAHVGLIYLED